MPKISVVIPTYTLTDELEELAVKCAESLGEADEIIICEDGGNYSEKLRNICHSYIYNRKNLGFTGNVNRGWRFASGDFVMIVNSDVEKISGSLEDLCIEGKVTSPLIENQHIEGLAGPFFTVPDKIRKERGMLLEELRTYCSDEEFKLRTGDIFQKVELVVVRHLKSKTISAAKIDQTKESNKDKQTYEQLKEKGKCK